MKDDCREMFTRTCPISGCINLPCARFEDVAVWRWDLDKIEWEKADALLAAEAAKALKEMIERNRKWHSPRLLSWVSPSDS